MNQFSKFVFIFASMALIYSIIPDGAFSSIGPRKAIKKEVNYRTSFGSCPSRTAGTLALRLIKVFEETGSLKNVKQSIVEEKLDEKHFISSYKIHFDPLKRQLNFKFECPEPLMKVQIYKENGIDSYEAILVENGKLYDPTYEVLLQSEKKLNYPLPYLALPVGEMEEEIQGEITRVIRSLPLKFRKKISEVILNEKNDLTVILSLKGNPSSVFLGKANWSEKVRKLQKIVVFMESRRKIPAIINLTNAKKVVVKFNDKF